MGLADVRLIELRHDHDSRGVLTSIEAGRTIPFEIRRIFYMHGTPPGIERGGHAHRDTQQVIIPFAGSFNLELTDGRASQTHRLSDPNWGLYMPAMIFVRLYDFSPGAFCVVLADTHYDRAKSIRTWEEFAAASGRGA